MGTRGRCRSRRPRGDAGFTLLELSVVIVILAVMGAMVAPAAWWMSATRSGGAAMLLVQDLTYAREVAVHSGTTTWSVFDVPDQACSLLAEDPDAPGRDDAQALEDRSTGAACVRFLGVGEFAGSGMVSVSFDGGSEVGFDWLGRPLNETGAALAARGVITLTSGYGIEVEPGTGAAWTTSP